MDSLKESGSIKIFFPRELLENETKDYSKCLFVGWKSTNNQIFIINAYSESKAQRISSVLDSINTGSKLMNLTYMKNGLEYINEYKFVRKYDADKCLHLSLSDSKTGCVIKSVIVFIYNNSSFDFKYTNLFKNLIIKDKVLDESSQINSDIGSCSIICTTLKNYIDIQMSNSNAELKNEIGLSDMCTVNRKNDFISSFSYSFHQFFMKITLYLSLISFHFLKLLQHNNKFINFMENTSNFVAIILARLRVISSWHKLYGDLLTKTEIVEYIQLRNELKGVAVSFYLDIFLGIAHFVLFRRLFVEKFFLLRSYLKIQYIERLKSLFYISTTKIFIYIKLNNEVATSLSKFVINKVILWSYVRQYLRPVNVFLFKMIQYASVFGLSPLFAFILDVFSFETKHLYYLYFIMLALMNYCHKYLYALIQLFKGKKWNVLKSELDTNKFTKEHLFIGVVFFIVFTLNYPTIWIFYISIITIMIPILVTKALIRIVIDVVYEFPYYFFLRNTFHPLKYTKGVYFKHVCKSSENVNKDGTLDYLYLEVMPNKISLVERNNMIKKKVGESLDRISPTKLIRKILKCGNIFDK